MTHTCPTCAAGPATAPSSAGRRAAARALIDGQLCMLTRLAEIGMDLAEDAGRDAAAAPEGEAPATRTARRADATLVYTRAARAVRMSIALQSRLLKDLDDLDGAEGDERYRTEGPRRVQVKTLLKRAIEAEAETGERGEDEIKHLSHAARERLKDEEEYGDLLDGPLSAVVARICKDLGLAPDWAALGVGRWVGDGGGGALPVGGWGKGWDGGERAGAEGSAPEAGAPLAPPVDRTADRTLSPDLSPMEGERRVRIPAPA